MKNEKFNALSSVFVVMWGILIIATTANGEITETKLTVSDVGKFGASVSISGNYAVIGGPAFSWTDTAYIFKREGTTWTQQATLTASGGNPVW